MKKSIMQELADIEKRLEEEEIAQQEFENTAIPMGLHGESIVMRRGEVNEH